MFLFPHMHISRSCWLVLRSTPQDEHIPTESLVGVRRLTCVLRHPARSIPTEVSERSAQHDTTRSVFP